MVGPYKCAKCDAKFADSAHLRRHLARKTPCNPILDRDPVSTKPTCRYCGRQFTKQPALSRHMTQRCKIANSEEGMDKLMEHTLARQNRELNAKVDRLAEMLEKQLALVAQGAPQMAIQNQGDAMVNTGPIQVNNTNNTLNIVKVKIIPWARDGCLNISAEQMAAAFRENERLAEYAKWPEHELTNPEKAPPFISELFMDLIKRAHADPASRNVYLNPKRSDQVLVCVGDDEHWEVLPFDEATRVMHDGVKRKISVVILTNDERNKVPLGAQNALSLAGLMYEDEPEAYVKRARVPMAAHLATLALQASAPKIVQ